MNTVVVMRDVTHLFIGANAALFQMASRLILAAFSSKTKRDEAAISIWVRQIWRKPDGKVEKRVRVSNPKVGS
jgi:hypothetical protein